MLLGATAPAEAPVVVTYLAGRLPQRKLGVGWRALSGERPPPAPEPRLTVADTDAALAGIAAASGTGATGRRRQLLAELLAAATEEEQDFLARLISGELRQGALRYREDKRAAQPEAVASVEAVRALLPGKTPA
ncbi:hypothetical protein [Streptomyces mayteni]